MPSYISFTKLANGENVALGAIEITSIPHISIIDENLSEEKINTQYKNEIAGFLNEIYQIYRSSGMNQSTLKDISVELLWITLPVRNQPYQASIKLYIIFRAIDRDKANAQKLVESQLSLEGSFLSGQKYDWQNIDYNVLAREALNISKASIKAITKEERIENLKNQILPY